MTLIKSISGIRGTIGGQVGQALTPLDVVKFTAAFGTWAKHKTGKNKVVIGRDARLSGEVISKIVSSTLMSLGLDVVDLGLSTTPTVEMAVVWESAGAGIIITASHNPIQWNALKLLNEEGEFISAQDGQAVIDLAASEDFSFCEVHKLGTYKQDDTYLDKHIQAILELELVDRKAIEQRNFKIVVDGVNSTGGTAVPQLLKALGIKTVEKLNCEPTGYFTHNPEPLPENLTQISEVLRDKNFDLGIVVDPDVDRLALVCEDGEMFGEEYTLVAVADYVISKTPGATVSNLSSTRALKDVTEKAGLKYFTAAVGEVNVVRAMKVNSAVIGGEGNGGIIYPALHYGRDGLVGIALFLTHLAKFGKSISSLKMSYPSYHISKNKIELTPDIDVDRILEAMKDKYKNYNVIDIDGVKIEFEKEWVHLRKSNTEPIIRIYAESDTHATSDYLANKIIQDMKDIVASR